MSDVVAAVDLGATSGRVVTGEVSGGRLVAEVVARFDNRPVTTIDGMHWDVLDLFANTLDGLAVAHRRSGGLASIGVDSWGVDYGLMRAGRLLANPFHYRDRRTAVGVDAVDAIASRGELYSRNGLQFLPFNTIYQLAAERLAGTIGLADALLLIPDLINYWLTGNRFTEETNASTTGLLDVADRVWDVELMQRLQLPSSILCPLIEPGSTVGETMPYVTEHLGALRSVPVVAVGSHDTASAVVAVPMEPSNSAYISCGTWGLVGFELERPVLSEESRRAGFTNERGVDGRIRYLHNVMGLWLLSESIRQWEADGSTVSLTGLLAEAAALRVPVAVFDADDPEFLAPGRMADRIAEHCGAHGLPVPRTPAEFVRSIVESLADAFGRTVVAGTALAGRSVETVHIVGGGARNALLCQRTADLLGVPVVAGPVEATAMGNLLVQARRVGLVGGTLAEIRAVVERSTELVRYSPRPEGRLH